MFSTIHKTWQEKNVNTFKEIKVCTNLVSVKMKKDMKRNNCTLQALISYRLNIVF